MITIEEKIAVMQAYVDGKKIEKKRREDAKWRGVIYPLWNWADFDYRVKPVSM